MTFISKYRSPLGELTIACNEAAVTGLWFAGQKYYMAGAGSDYTEAATELFLRCCDWLERYFNAEKPALDFELAPAGSPFRQRIFSEICRIPYGETATYRELARKAGADGALAARAAGVAAGHNPVSIIIPCHRVIGSDGGLHGYAGGLERKAALLELERRSL